MCKLTEGPFSAAPDALPRPQKEQTKAEVETSRSIYLGRCD
jgi:hypothetical protein